LWGRFLGYSCRDSHVVPLRVSLIFAIPTNPGGQRRVTLAPQSPSTSTPNSAFTIVPIVPLISPVPERLRKSVVVNSAQPIVGPPMHALRLLGKLRCYVRTSSQARPDFPRLRYPTVAHRFLLACIGQAQALPARENIAGVVNRCDLPSTIPSVGIDLTSEPGASATRWHSVHVTGTRCRLFFHSVEPYGRER
jgi:hypothetical protein